MPLPPLWIDVYVLWKSRQVWWTNILSLNKSSDLLKSCDHKWLLKTFKFDHLTINFYQTFKTCDQFSLWIIWGIRPMYTGWKLCGANFHSGGYFFWLTFHVLPRAGRRVSSSMVTIWWKVYIYIELGLHPGC